MDIKTPYLSLELTNICQKITGNKIKINKINKKNKNDVKYFVISNKKVFDKIKWKPKKKNTKYTP